MIRRPVSKIFKVIVLSVILFACMGGISTAYASLHAADNFTHFIYLPWVAAAAKSTPTPTPTLVPTSTPTPTQSPSSDTVNPQNRQESLNFYKNKYLTASGAINWTGNIAGCNSGNTDAAYKLAELQRINYFRAMGGVPAKVTFTDAANRLAQAAALMMSANNSLNHAPPSSWKCYSTDGKDGAGSSNLALGLYGWNAIALYMKDSGSNNTFAGHRRWILYPQTQEMGIGDIPGGSGSSAANALHVFDAHMWEARPATREEFVSWPPPGFVPSTVIYPRWSFAYAGADFSATTVSMVSGGVNLPISQAGLSNGYGENTIVWIPNNMSDGANWPTPAADTTYSVTLQNVKINGQSRTFHYDVTAFDPAK